jgi:hypothetical protein
MPAALRDVRYQVKSGKHLLAPSISEFDPMQTWPRLPLRGEKGRGLDLLPC